MRKYMEKSRIILAAAVIASSLSGLLVTSGMVLPAQGGIMAPDRAAAIGLNDGLTSTKSSDMPEKLDGPGGLFTQIVNILLFIIGAVAVIMIIVGGIRYVTSNGDQAHVKAAKDTIMYAIIGLVVAILAYAIVNFLVSNVKTAGTTTPTTTTTTP